MPAIAGPSASLLQYPMPGNLHGHKKSSLVLRSYLGAGPLPTEGVHRRAQPLLAAAAEHHRVTPLQELARHGEPATRTQVAVGSHSLPLCLLHPAAGTRAPWPACHAHTGRCQEHRLSLPSRPSLRPQSTTASPRCRYSRPLANLHPHIHAAVGSTTACSYLHWHMGPVVCKHARTGEWQELVSNPRLVMRCNVLTRTQCPCFEARAREGLPRDVRSPKALAAAGDDNPLGVIIMAACCCRLAEPRPTGGHALAAWPSNDGRLQASRSGHAPLVMGMTTLQLECTSSVCRTLGNRNALAFGADPCWHANWDPRELSRPHARMFGTATGASTHSP